MSEQSASANEVASVNGDNNSGYAVEESEIATVPPEILLGDDVLGDQSVVVKGKHVQATKVFGKVWTKPNKQKIVAIRFGVANDFMDLITHSIKIISATCRVSMALDGNVDGYSIILIKSRRLNRCLFAITMVRFLIKYNLKIDMRKMRTAWSNCLCDVASQVLGQNANQGSTVRTASGLTKNQSRAKYGMKRRNRQDTTISVQQNVRADPKKTLRGLEQQLSISMTKKEIDNVSGPRNTTKAMIEHLTTTSIKLIEPSSTLPNGNWSCVITAGTQEAKMSAADLVRIFAHWKSDFTWIQPSVFVINYRNQEVSESTTSYNDDTGSGDTYYDIESLFEPMSKAPATELYDKGTIEKVRRLNIMSDDIERDLQAN